MRLFHQIQEVIVRIRRDGFRPVAEAIYYVFKEQLIPPWERLYWLRACDVASPPADHPAALRVVTRFDELSDADRAMLESGVGASSMSIFKKRLAAGAELHMLIVDGRIAGTRFVALGSRTPFQNVVLGDCDAMGLDVRIEPDMRGRGLAPLFFSLSISNLAERGIDRVFATVNVRNERSIRTLERAGFRYVLNMRKRGKQYRYDAEIIG